LRDLADRGRTVFFSSHLMSEMALVADRLIILHRGRLIADTTLTDLLRQHSEKRVVAQVNDLVERKTLVESLARYPETSVTVDENGTLTVQGITTEALGRHARDVGVALAKLTTLTKSLEDVFMSITTDGPAAQETGRSHV